MDIVTRVRAAIRGLGKSPGFTIVSVLTLALGVGANTAVFSVAYGVLRRPLPYHDPASLVLVSAFQDFAGQRRLASFSGPDLPEYRRARTLASLAGYAKIGHALAGGEVVEPLSGALVSGTFFEILGQAPVAGRLLGPNDDGPVAVVSDRLARRLYGAQAAAVGKDLLLGERTYAVVGVAGPEFRFPDERTDVWTPIEDARRSGVARWLDWPRGGGVNIVARLASPAAAARAEAELGQLAADLARGRGEPARAIIPSVVPIAEAAAQGAGPALRLLTGAVALVLLVAAANVAHLLLARHAVRERDAAVRLALGASRRRLVADAMIESALIGSAGAAAGALLAAVLVRGLVWWAPPQIPRLDAVRMDALALAFAAACAGVAVIAAGFVPAWLASRRDPAAALGAGTRIAGRPGGERLRALLVAAELAIALFLLAGAGVLTRSFVRLAAVDLGARTDHVLSARIDLSLGRSLTEAQQRTLGATLVGRARALPGVTAAALAAAVPPNGRVARMTLKDVPTDRGIVHELAVNAAPATPELFATLGIPRITGRTFAEDDDDTRPRVAIVSAGLARDLFPAGAVGRTLSLPTPSSGVVTATIVGVVGDVNYRGLTEAAEPTIYMPFAQQPWPTAFLLARTAGEPSHLAARLREAIGAVDRRVGLAEMRSLDDAVWQERSQPAFRTAVVGAIAAVTLALAAVGLAGLVSYSVARRTSEIGVRVALGARDRDVLTLVLRETLAMGAAGGAIGLLLALALARVLRGFLFGVEPVDPTSLAGALTLLGAVAAAAAWLPARRACRIDPTIALRAE